MADALSVISLEQAKEFLVVDFPDRDAEITRHIKSAIGIVEVYTHHFLYQRSKTYTVSGCGTEIYDYPIILPVGTKSTTNVLSVTVFGANNSTIAATIGYATVADIPEQLISAAEKIITYLYENKDVYTSSLPADVQVLINQLRRSPTF